MRINLIYAKSRNGAIGVDNTLPWHLPEDLAHFKRLTKGCPVIMGRKTWDSLPAAVRPLRGRKNIVVTRQESWSAPGALRATSLENAILLCAEAEIAWVIGGGELLRQAEPIASGAFVTEIDQEVAGDAFAPELDKETWREQYREPHRSKEGLTFFFTYAQRLSPT